MIRECIGLKLNGEKCQAPAMANSEFCFFHHPEFQSQRKAASAAGGAAKRPQMPRSGVPAIPLRSAADFTNLHATLLRYLAAGEIDDGILNALVQLANYLRRALALEALEAKIQNVESLHYTGKPLEPAPAQPPAVVDLYEPRLDTPGDVRAFLECVIANLLAGGVDRRLANSAGCIANSQLGVLSAELKKRENNLKAGEEGLANDNEKQQLA